MVGDDGFQWIFFPLLPYPSKETFMIYKLYRTYFILKVCFRKKKEEGKEEE
jgi:hypothetical protein